MGLLERYLSIRKVSESDTQSTFLANNSLSKPDPNARGVFGGYLIAQAMLAAFETVSSEFKVHSVHCYFILPGDDKLKNTYKVDKVSTTRNFAKRTVSIYQEDELRFQMMISFTKNNSLKNSNESESKYNFQSDLPSAYNTTKFESFKSVNKIPELLLFDGLLSYRFPRGYSNYKLCPDELNTNPANRTQYYFVKATDKLADKRYQYLILAGISDSFFLVTLSRILRVSIRKLWNVSLDHSIYFHDEDVDCNEYMLFKISASVFANNRVILRGELFNRKEILIATIIQEGLVYVRESTKL